MPKSDLDSDIEGFAGSPRANHLRTAAKETISRAESAVPTMNFQQPMPILLQSLRPYSPDLNEDYCFVSLRFPEQLSNACTDASQIRDSVSLATSNA